MRLPIPFGRKGLIAAAAIAAGVVYWRVRVRRPRRHPRRARGDGRRVTGDPRPGRGREPW